MTTPVIVLGTALFSENILNVASTAVDQPDGLGFSDLFASLVSAARPTLDRASGAAEAEGDFAESAVDDDQASQEPKDIASDPAPIFAFMALFSPNVGAPEPLAGFAGEPALIGNRGNPLSTDPAEFLRPLADAAPVQDLDGQNERSSVAHPASESDDAAGAMLNGKVPPAEVLAKVGIAVPTDMTVSNHTKSSDSEKSSPSTAEPLLDQDNPTPTDSVKLVRLTSDSLTATPKEFNVSDGKQEDKSFGRSSIDSKAPVPENPGGEKSFGQVNGMAAGQASLGHGREQTGAGPSAYKPGEKAGSGEDGQPPRSAPMLADAAAARWTQAHAASEDTGEPAWQPVLQRVTEQIAQQVRIGQQQAVIELDPAGLGKIRIDLRIEGEQIHARIVAEEQGTKALIESRLPELRQALEIRQVDFANLQVERQNVTSGGGHSGQTFNDGFRQGQGPGRDDSGGADDLAKDPSQREDLPSPAYDAGRISMWA